MAILLSNAKKYTRLSGGAYKSIRPDFFGEENRRYFPLNPSPADIEAELNCSNVYASVRDMLNKNGYVMGDYIEGTAYHTKERKQPLKIGKILQCLEETTLMEEFKADPCRSYKKLNIVISRHPVDLAGMSAGRGWSSCMNIEAKTRNEGCNNYYVRRDIHGGTLIAYLVSQGDTNIQNPICRILIKRLESTSGNALYAVANKYYGAANAYFKKEVQKIVEELNKNAPEDVYKFDEEFFYNDDEGFSEVDTRSDGTIRARERVRHKAALRKQMEMFEAFKEQYQKVQSFFDNPAFFQDLSGQIKKLSWEKAITDSEYADIYNARRQATENASNLYVRFIWEQIQTGSPTSEEAEFLFWKFINDFKLDLGSWIEAMKIFGEQKNYYYFGKFSDRGRGYPLDKLHMYDFGILSDNMCDALVVLSTNYLKENDMEYYFEYIHKIIQKRNKRFENLIFTLPEAYAKEWAMAYWRSSHRIQNAIDDGIQNAETTAVEREYLQRLKDIAN